MIFELKKSKSPPIANFNPTGLIFAIVYSVSDMVSKIKLFDTKKCNENCFATWEFECPEIRSIVFF